MKPILALAFLFLVIFGCYKTFYIPENPTIGEVVSALQPKCSNGEQPKRYTFTNCWNKDMVRGTSFGYWTEEDLPKLVARQKKEDPTWECAPFSYDRSICPEELK